MIFTKSLPGIAGWIKTKTVDISHNGIAIDGEGTSLMQTDAHAWIHGVGMHSLTAWKMNVRTINIHISS